MPCIFICFFCFKALLFGGPDSLPFFLSRLHIPALDVVVDPCAAILVFIVTGLLCVGIKEVVMYVIILQVPSIFLYLYKLTWDSEYVQSTVAQGIATIANVCAMVFVIVAGTYLGFKTGWSGYQLPTGY